MVTREDLESFLLRVEGLEFDEIEEGMYLVRSHGSGPPVVVSHSAPLLLLRMKVMDLPEAGVADAELFRVLLELNATDVVHGAYGLEERELILSDTLKLETLDFEEFRDSLESMQLAAVDHMERIRSLAGFGTGSAGGDR